MRGPIEGVPTPLQPILYSFQQAREDVERYTTGLTTEQVWARPFGFGSVGFHIRHIGGATDRLMTYVRGEQLSDAQLAELKAEHDPGASAADLLAEMNAKFEAAEAVVRSLDPSKLDEARGVGRKMLPTTVIGLIVHIAEHNQRHVGQCISAAKLARQTGILDRK